MKELLEKIREKATREINSSDDIEELRIKYLGKKGELTAVLRGMGNVSPEERPLIGQLANEVRGRIEEALAAKAELKKKRELERRLASEALDVTIPGEKFTVGHRHPLAQTEAMLRDIFVGMGFSVAEGPEIEYDYYNFEALNLPKNHPARDTQDTFYITDNILLRSQTSPVQVRTMEVQKPPIRVISPGRVYRRCNPFSDFPSGGGACRRSRHHDGGPQRDSRAVCEAHVRRGDENPLPPASFPVYGAFRRGGCVLLCLRRQGLPALQGRGLD